MPKNENDTTTATARAPRSRVASASRTRSAKGAPPAQAASGAKRGRAPAAAPADQPVPTPPARRGRSAAAPASETTVAASPAAEPVRRKGRRGAAAPPEIAEVASPAEVAVGSAAEEVVVGSAPAVTVEPDMSAPADGADAPEIAKAPPAETHAGTEQTGIAAEEPTAAVGEGTQESEPAGGIDAALDAVPPPSALLTCELSGPLRATVKVQAIKAVLGMVVAGLPTRMTLPVLSHVLLTAEGEGQLRITATDLDTTVTRRIPAVLEGGGAALVSGKKLHEIVKELPDPCSLSISLAGEEVVLVCDATRTRFRLPTLPVDEFPSPPRVRWDEDGFNVGAGVLVEMISRTSFAASTEETRPILNGVLWELRADGMTMVATNGHRLSSASVESGTGHADQLILFPHGLKLVSALAGGSDQPLRIAHTQNHAGFRGDGWEVLTRLIEGPYPNWRQVVPQDNDKVLIVDRVAFMAAVRRMAIIAETQTHRVRVSLKGATLSFSVANSGVGTGSEEIAVDYDGDPLEIGFNAMYLLEVLKYIPTGEVKITFKAPERAATIHPVLQGDEESVLTHDVLVMPIRLL